MIWKAKIFQILRRLFLKIIQTSDYGESLRGITILLKNLKRDLKYLLLCERNKKVFIAFQWIVVDVYITLAIITRLLLFTNCVFC